MKKYYYKLKLSNFELRVAVDALNAMRLKQKAQGKDFSATSDLLLILLDALDGVS